MNFRCTKCGSVHELTDLAWHFAEPLPWMLASDEERVTSELTPDQCELVINGQLHHFIHALLQIPVHGSAAPFVWGVWCSLSDASHLEISAMWDSPERTRIGPHFGWLCNRVPAYPDSLHLKTHVHQREPGLRPLVELEATDHPLSVDQRHGITPERLHQIVEELHHMRPPNE